MSDEEYLEAVLRDQTLAPDIPELKQLQQHREDVEGLLREEFADCRPTIRYGGSKAKGTMIRESYDLDIICYFPHDESGPGDSLQEIYDNVEEKLRERYLTERKMSAIRLRSTDPPDQSRDFHIDVVPGRFVDETKGDVWLHQNGGRKARLKTNLETHIAHVRDSGVQDAIRLMKLWRVKQAIEVKTFVLELLTVDVLKDHQRASLPVQVRTVLKKLRDESTTLHVEDPANPTGNDLSELLSASVRQSMSAAARAALTAIDEAGWQRLFGPTQEADRRAALMRAAATLPPTARHQPWHGG